MKRFPENKAFGIGNQVTVPKDQSNETIKYTIHDLSEVSGQLKVEETIVFDKEYERYTINYPVMRDLQSAT